MRYLIVVLIGMVISACGLLVKNKEEKIPKMRYLELKSTSKACVSGHLKNTEGEALVGVKVYLQKQNLAIVDGVHTDENGRYEICIPQEGNFVLRVRFAGYESQDVALKLIKGKRLVFNDEIVLQEAQIRLEKPLIYLYPQEKINVRVEVDVDGGIVHSYPKYKEAWEVEARPDGTLYDAKGRSYYGLYWEADIYKDFSITSGNVVAKKELILFLETSLATLGLNEREANEFIMYWLPKLAAKDYALIHFSTEEYAEKFPLKVEPKADQEIRVMMYFKGLDEEIDFVKQELQKVEREKNAFVLVEWGGCALKE